MIGTTRDKKQGGAGHTIRLLLAPGRDHQQLRAALYGMTSLNILKLHQNLMRIGSVLG